MTNSETDAMFQFFPPRWKQIPVMLVLGMFALSVRASADSAAPPSDYLKATANGQFELVMLPTYQFSRKDAVLRKRYPRSGLYRKGAPQRALWTIDWYARQIYPASDGHHLVRIGPWPSSPEELAVAFYRDGRLLRQLKINELVKDPESLPHSVSHFMWSKSISFNDAKRQLRIATLGGENYLFNDKGELLEGRVVPPYQAKTPADGFFHKGDVVGLIGLGAAALPEIGEAVRTGQGRTQELGLIALCANGGGALQTLERLSRDEKPQVRAMVADALREISVPEGKPVLLELLKDKESSVRIPAIAGLVQIHQADEGSAAIETARAILRSGTSAEKQELLFALGRFRIPALVSDVLPLLDGQKREQSRGRYTLEGVNSWLGSTTFQNFQPLDEGPDARQKIARAWRTWWAANQNRSSDEWFVQAVERDFFFLRGESYQSALSHLEELTGQNFGAEGEWNASKSPIQWRAWWQRNKSQRPGQILIASLRTAQKKVDSMPIEALGQLPLQCDTRDVTDLVALYLAYPSQNGWERSYIETALRYITNIDSFGVPQLGSDKEQQVLREWKQFAA